MPNFLKGGLWLCLLRANGLQRWASRREAAKGGVEPRGRVVLPATFYGSARYMQRRTDDAHALGGLLDVDVAQRVGVAVQDETTR